MAKMETMTGRAAAGTDQPETVERLSRILADTYALYLKTQNFHWNVTGPHFAALHALFEKQYQELAGAADAIAERIRAVGGRAPGSFGEFQSLGAIGDASGTPAAEEMAEELLTGHEWIVQETRQAEIKANEEHDPATVDLMSERVGAHQKAAWMLRSFLGR